MEKTPTEMLRIITGHAMIVHNEYHAGLMETAYEAALEYLLLTDGIKVERQVFVPVFWKGVKLEQNYRLDMVVADDIIVELKAVAYINDEHRRQLKGYLNLTHFEYGILINFGAEKIYSEWYHRDPQSGKISKINPAIRTITR